MSLPRGNIRASQRQRSRGLTPINVFRVTREPVFLAVAALFASWNGVNANGWHSPRSHSGTLSSRKRSGWRPAEKKPRCESHFTRNQEPGIFAKPIFVRRTQRIFLFTAFLSLLLFLFFFYIQSYMICWSRSRERSRGFAEPYPDLFLMLIVIVDLMRDRLSLPRISRRIERVFSRFSSCVQLPDSREGGRENWRARDLEWSRVY